MCQLCWYHTMDQRQQHPLSPYPVPGATPTALVSGHTTLHTRRPTTAPLFSTTSHMLLTLNLPAVHKLHWQGLSQDLETGCPKLAIVWQGLSQDLETGCPKLAIVIFQDILFFQRIQFTQFTDINMHKFTN